MPWLQGATPEWDALQSRVDRLQALAAAYQALWLLWPCLKTAPTAFYTLKKELLARSKLFLATNECAAELSAGNAAQLMMGVLDEAGQAAEAFASIPCEHGQ